jgi:hypothetical protein
MAPIPDFEWSDGPQELVWDLDNETRAPGVGVQFRASELREEDQVQSLERLVQRQQGLWSILAKHVSLV